MAMDIIDRQTSTPPFIQLSNIIRKKIQKGIFLPGDRLPSQSYLCKNYNVSPMTARRAIKELIEQSLVSAVKGSGTYVNKPDMRNGLFRLEEFYKIFEDPELTRVKILEVKIIEPTPSVATKLSLHNDDYAILIRRLLIQEGNPLIYHKEYLVYDPRRKIVETELEVTALHGLFAGVAEDKFKWGELKISTAPLDQNEAELLNSFYMQSAFHIDHVFYDFDDIPVSWGCFICPGDHLQFTTTVGIKNLP